LQNGGVTSDEDVSIIGSPSIRRRLGSCSGGPDQQSTKEDTYSPGIMQLLEKNCENLLNTKRYFFLVN